MRHLLICEGIIWSQESIPNAAQLGTDTGIVLDEIARDKGQGWSATLSLPDYGRVARDPDTITEPREELRPCRRGSLDQRRIVCTFPPVAETRYSKEIRAMFIGWQEWRKFQIN